MLIVTIQPFFLRHRRKKKGSRVLHLKRKSPHHLPCGRQPLSSLHHTEGSVPQLLKQRQILLWDEAGQGLLLLIERSPTTTTGVRGQDSLLQAQWRCGRQLTEGGGRLALLGEVSSVWPLSTEHLRKRKNEGKRASALVEFHFLSLSLSLPGLLSPPDSPHPLTGRTHSVGPWVHWM